jgi:hypothetical protein
MRRSWLFCTVLHSWLCELLLEYSLNCLIWLHAICSYLQN